MSGRGGARLGVAAALVASGLALALWTGVGRQPHRSGGAAGAAVRTLVVADPTGPLPRRPSLALRDCLGRPRTCVNGAQGIVLAYRVAGSLPAGAAGATVLRDENCQPDRFGVSHCLNALRLAGGRTLTVRHDHKMSNDPCLAPGERVRVLALRAYLRR